MKIVEKEITLRNFLLSDLEDVYDYSKYDNVAKMAGWKPHQNIEESKEVLQRYLTNKRMYAIVDDVINKVIGHIAINEDSVDHNLEIKELGFALHPNYQGQGIMYHVVMKVLEVIFSNQVKKVYACCFQHNIASKKLIEKCGFDFEQEGVFEAVGLGETYQTYEYAYVKEKWLKNQ